MSPLNNLDQYRDISVEKDNKEYPLLILLGPTAVGKTELSLGLADIFDAEIISADSMQIYKDMNIGTAKLEKDKRKEIPHHMIDIISPQEKFSVADYKKEADRLIEKIVRKRKIPLMVGGTGLYINAVVDGFMLPEMEIDQNLRQELREKAKKQGNEYVHNILAEIDPSLAEKLHPNDLRRVIRGIEIYEKTGKTKTYYKREQEKRPDRYKTLKIGLTRERDELYDRINQRVDEMIEAGLLEEVKFIKEKYGQSKTAVQALGYKEILSYFAGKYDFDEALRIIKRDSRHLAKKQLTFFKRDEKINWFNLSNTSTETVIEEIKNIIKKTY